MTSLNDLSIFTSNVIAPKGRASRDIIKDIIENRYNNKKNFTGNKIIVSSEKGLTDTSIYPPSKLNLIQNVSSLVQQQIDAIKLNITSNFPTIIEEKSKQLFDSTTNIRDEASQYISNMSLDKIVNGNHNKLIVNDTLSTDLNVTGTIIANDLEVLSGSFTIVTTDKFIANDMLVNDGNQVIQDKSQLQDGSSLTIIQNGIQNILEVYSDTNNKLTIMQNGKIGIGNNTPNEMLDIKGNVQFTENINEISKNQFDYLKNSKEDLQNQIDILTNDFSKNNLSVKTANIFTSNVVYNESETINNYIINSSNSSIHRFKNVCSTKQNTFTVGNGLSFINNTLELTGNITNTQWNDNIDHLSYGNVNIYEGRITVNGNEILTRDILDTKQDSLELNGISDILYNNLGPNKVLISGTDGKMKESSSITLDTIDYIKNTKSPIQTQLDTSHLLYQNFSNSFQSSINIWNTDTSNYINDRKTEVLDTIATTKLSKNVTFGAGLIYEGNTVSISDSIAISSGESQVKESTNWKINYQYGSNIPPAIIDADSMNTLTFGNNTSDMYVWYKFDETDNTYSTETEINIGQIKTYPPVKLNFVDIDNTNKIATTTLSQQVYGNGDYIVQWTSQWGSAGGYQAFISSGSPHSASSTYNTSTSISRYTDRYIESSYWGEWIRIKLPSSIYLQYVKLIPRSGHQARFPVDYKIYGTNNGNDWTELIHHQNTTYAGSISAQESPHNDTIFEIFNEFAIVIHKIYAAGSTNSSFFNFNGMTLHGTDVISEIVLQKIHDSSSYNRDATGYNSPTFDNVIKREGTHAISFAGGAANTDSQYLTVPSTNFSLWNGFTISCWVMFEDNAVWGRIIDFGDGQDYNNILLARTGIQNIMTLEILRGASKTTARTINEVIINNTWMHITWVITKTPEWKFYVNGVLQPLSSSTFVYPTSTTYNNCYIAKSNWTNDRYFKGKMDDFRLYNRALTSEEVIALYNYPVVMANVVSIENVPFYTNTNDLMLWYRFDVDNFTTNFGNLGHAYDVTQNSTLIDNYYKTKGDGALDLNGSYMIVPTDLDFTTNDIISICFWMKLTELQSQWDVVIYKNMSGNNAINIQRNGSTNYWSIHFGAAHVTTDGFMNDFTLDDTTWRHYCFTFLKTIDGHVMIKVYKNAMEQPVFTKLIKKSWLTIPISNLTIGDTAYPLRHYIDDFRIYSRELYASELQQLYEYEPPVVSHLTYTPSITDNTNILNKYLKVYSDKLTVAYNTNHIPGVFINHENTNSDSIPIPGTGGYRYFAFTSTTESSSIIFSKDTVCDILVVGGGGGGGSRFGGGGGAGGLVYYKDYNMNSGTYYITVGNGGLGGISTGGTGTQGAGAGGNGNNSSIIGDSINIIGIGGGGGGRGDTGNGFDGGSGGGCAGRFAGIGGNSLQSGQNNFGNIGGLCSGTTSSGNYVGGGGGGAESKGFDGNDLSFNRGGGGRGKYINITGKATYYSGGGGGGADAVNNVKGGMGGKGGGGNGGGTNQFIEPTAGGINTGGGGGGGITNYNFNSNTPGADGGSGIVIIRWFSPNEDTVATIDDINLKQDRFKYGTGLNYNPYTKELIAGGWKNNTNYISHENVSFATNTLSLYNGKRFNDISVYDNIAKYPDVSLNGPTTISPYTSQNYIVQWSSEDATTNYRGHHLFNEDRTDVGWITANNKYYDDSDIIPSGFVVGDAIDQSSYIGDDSNNYGEWVKIELPNPIYLSYVKIYERRITGWSFRNPAFYVIYGSNDGNTWTQLIVNKTNQATYTTDQDRVHTSKQVVTSQNYKHFAITVTKTIGGQIGSCGFSELEFYGSQTMDTVNTRTSIIRSITLQDYSFKNDISDMLAWYKFDAEVVDGGLLTNYGNLGPDYNATIKLTDGGIIRVKGDIGEYKYKWTGTSANTKVGNWIKLPDNILEKLNSGYTFSWWSVDNDVNDYERTIFSVKKGTDISVQPSATDILLSAHLPYGGNNNIYWDFGDGVSNYQRLETPYNPPEGKLANWVVTKEISGGNQLIKVYRNSVLIMSGTFTNKDFPSGDNDNMIGVNSTNVAGIAGQFLDKSLEDFRIYNRALSPQEIYVIYENNVPPRIDNTIIPDITKLGQLETNNVITKNILSIDSESIKLGQHIEIYDISVDMINDDYIKYNYDNYDSSNNKSYCMRAKRNIWIDGADVVWTSDERIKKDIKDINDDSALEKILAIQPKTYKYIDHVERGKNKVYGFISQQVREVIPEATSQTNKYIPNIYKVCSYFRNKIVLPKDFDISSIVTTYTGNILSNNVRLLSFNGKIYDVPFILNGDKTSRYIMSISGKIPGDGQDVFVYGTEINDMTTIDKSYIYTLNVCATQILSRKTDVIYQNNSNISTKLLELEYRFGVIESMIK